MKERCTDNQPLPTGCGLWMIALILHSCVVHSIAYCVPVSFVRVSVPIAVSASTHSTDIDQSFVLEKLQQTAAPASKSFVPTEFKPLINKKTGALSFFADDVLASSSIAAGYSKDENFTWDSRETVQTQDGVWFYVDRKYSAKPDRWNSTTAAVPVIEIDKSKTNTRPVVQTIAESLSQSNSQQGGRKGVMEPSLQRDTRPTVPSNPKAKSFADSIATYKTERVAESNVKPPTWVSPKPNVKSFAKSLVEPRRDSTVKPKSEPVVAARTETSRNGERSNGSETEKSAKPPTVESVSKATQQPSAVTVPEATVETISNPTALSAQDAARKSIPGSVVETVPESTNKSVPKTTDDSKPVDGTLPETQTGTETQADNESKAETKEKDQPSDTPSKNDDSSQKLDSKKLFFVEIIDENDAMDAEEAIEAPLDTPSVKSAQLEEKTEFKTSRQTTPIVQDGKQFLDSRKSIEPKENVSDDATTIKTTSIQEPSKTKPVAARTVKNASNQQGLFDNRKPLSPNAYMSKLSNNRVAVSKAQQQTQVQPVQKQPKPRQTTPQGGSVPQTSQKAKKRQVNQGLWDSRAPIDPNSYISRFSGNAPHKQPDASQKSNRNLTAPIANKPHNGQGLWDNRAPLNPNVYISNLSARNVKSQRQSLKNEEKPTPRSIMATDSSKPIQPMNGQGLWDNRKPLDPNSYLYKLSTMTISPVARENASSQTTPADPAPKNSEVERLISEDKRLISEDKQLIVEDEKSAEEIKTSEDTRQVAPIYASPYQPYARPATSSQKGYSQINTAVKMTTANLEVNLVTETEMATTEEASTSPLTRPTVLLLPGLESSSQCFATTQLAKAFNDIGMDCVCINFYGVPDTDNKEASKQGCTNDLLQYLDLMKGQNGGQAPPVYLAGFSSGASIVLKCLGDLADRAVTEYNIRGATALYPPLDQAGGSKVRSKHGTNRAEYANLMLDSLKKRAQEFLDNSCDGNKDTDVFDYKRAMSATTVADFDDAFMRALGFDSSTDFYKKMDCMSSLESIAVSTYIVGSIDDPLSHPNVWPYEKSREYGGPAPLKMVQTEYGGHLGGVDGSGVSMAALDVARFIEHVDRQFPYELMSLPPL